MASRHSRTATQALYRVFVQPLLFHGGQRSAIAPGLLPQITHTSPLGAAAPRARARAFSAAASPLLGAYRPPEARKPQDDEISARRIYLVNPETNQLDERLFTTHEVLARMDRRTHKLVQVLADSAAEGEPPSGIPICKLINKKEAVDALRRRQAATKDSRRASAIATSVKTLELNWAIADGDLGHRLEKMASFLDAGRKVEVILANKKKSRRASREECNEVLERLKKVVEGVAGAKQLGTQGEVGKMYSVLIQGKPIRVSSKKGNGGQTDPSPADAAAIEQPAQASTGP